MHAFDTAALVVNPFSTWRSHVAWMYIWWVCTRAARKENRNPNSHDHCLLSKWKCRTCAHTHLCNYRQTPYRNRVYRIRFGHDLDLWPLTLKTFSATPTHAMNISAKCHWNPSTKYGDITSRVIGVNGQCTRDRCSRSFSPPRQIAFCSPVYLGRMKYVILAHTLQRVDNLDAP